MTELHNLYETAMQILEKTMALGMTPEAIESTSVTAILTDRGNIYTGLNGSRLQNGVPSKTCSEYEAVTAMMMSGENRIIGIVSIAFKNRQVVVPCDKCRELICRINPDNITCGIMTDENTALSMQMLISGQSLDKKEENQQSVNETEPPAKSSEKIDIDGIDWQTDAEFWGNDDDSDSPLYQSEINTPQPQPNNQQPVMNNFNNNNNIPVMNNNFNNGFYNNFNNNPNNMNNFNQQPNIINSGFANGAAVPPPVVMNGGGQMMNNGGFYNNAPSQPVVMNSNFNNGMMNGNQPMNNGGFYNNPMNNMQNNQPVMNNMQNNNQPVMNNMQNNNQPVMNNMQNNNQPIMNNMQNNNQPIMNNMQNNNQPVMYNNYNAGQFNNQPLVSNNGYYSQQMHDQNPYDYVQPVPPSTLQRNAPASRYSNVSGNIYVHSSITSRNVSSVNSQNVSRNLGGGAGDSNGNSIYKQKLKDLLKTDNNISAASDDTESDDTVKQNVKMDEASKKAAMKAAKENKKKAKKSFFGR